jgi:predicted HAD superfamily Cof-like phosphohydrolase
MSDEHETHYKVQLKVEPQRVCQNYSQMNNYEMAQRAVSLVNPHWHGSAKTAAAAQVQAMFDQELTRMWDDIISFHTKYKLSYGGEPRLLPDDLHDFRVLFIGEELEEYAGLPKGVLTDFLKQQLQSRGPQVDSLKVREDQLDALVDMTYVVFGTAYLQGFNFAEAWRRVHRANMSKIRVERIEDSKRGSAFDVVKPQGWKPPCHADLVGTLGEESGLVEAQEHYDQEDTISPGSWSTAGGRSPAVSAVVEDVADVHDGVSGAAEEQEPDHGLF